MSHRVIIIEATYPPSGGAAFSSESPAPSPVKVSVTYTPDDSLTQTQIGHKVARMIKKCDEIGAVGAAASTEENGGA